MVYLNCDGELDDVIARVPGAGGLMLMKRIRFRVGSALCLPAGYGRQSRRDAHRTDVPAIEGASETGGQDS